MLWWTNFWDTWREGFVFKCEVFIVFHIKISPGLFKNHYLSNSSTSGMTYVMSLEVGMVADMVNMS